MSGVQHQRTAEINLASIIVRDRYLQPSKQSIAAMAKSLAERGQIAPIMLRWITRNTYRIVAGATRFEAAKSLNWEKIRAEIVNVANDLEYSILELAENLDRRDLTDDKRRDMKEKIREYQTKLLENVEPSVGGRGKKGGISEAARQAGVPETTARRRAKPRHNIKSGEVSGRRGPPAKAKTKYEKHKMTFDLTMAELERVDKFIKANEWSSRSELFRNAIRVYIGMGEARVA